MTAAFGSKDMADACSPVIMRVILRNPGRESNQVSATIGVAVFTLEAENLALLMSATPPCSTTNWVQSAGPNLLASSEGRVSRPLSSRDPSGKSKRSQKIRSKCVEEISSEAALNVLAKA